MNVQFGANLKGDFLVNLDQYDDQPSSRDTFKDSKRRKCICIYFNVEHCPINKIKNASC